MARFSILVAVFAGLLMSELKALPLRPQELPNFRTAQRTRVGAWQDNTNIVYRAEGTSYSFKGKRATYKLTTTNGVSRSIAVVVFADPEIKQSWIGYEQEFYFKWRGRIVGGRVMNGFFFARKSLARDDGLETPTELMARFDDDSIWEQMSVQDLDGVLIVTEIGYDFSPLFRRDPKTGAAMFPKVVRTQFKRDQLKLDISGGNNATIASVWIDIPTWKVLKVARDGVLLADQPTQQAARKESPITLPPHYKTKQAGWDNTTIPFYSSDGQLRSIQGKKAVYDVVGLNRLVFRVPVTAFVNDLTRNAWVGLESDFYFETAKGICGGKINDWGGIVWVDSWLDGWTYETVDGITTDFLSKVHGANAILSGMIQPEVVMAIPPASSTTTNYTKFDVVLKPSFVPPGAFPLVEGLAPLAGVKIEDDLLRIDINSGDGKSKASLWVNRNTRKIHKAIQDGEQTFPKP